MPCSGCSTPTAGRWASVKAFVWLIIIIFILGYLPDRAYYLTVGRTVDLGVLAWSPVNLCPPENETLPCPAPVGALVPWHPSPAELALPAARTDGAVLQVGTKILYIGGSDGTTAQKSVYISRTVGTGNFDKWESGPDLPAPRADASVAYVAGSIYLIGGIDDTSAPTNTVYVLTPDSVTGDLGEWKTAPDALTLPEARSGAAAAVTTDGVAPDRRVATPTDRSTTTWKSLLDAKGALGKWIDGAAAVRPAGRRDRGRRRRLRVAVRRQRRPGSRRARSSEARSASPPPPGCRPTPTPARSSAGTSPTAPTCRSPGRTRRTGPPTARSISPAAMTARVPRPRSTGRSRPRPAISPNGSTSA